jgi:DNA-binding transcriptional ArsR family regulator
MTGTIDMAEIGFLVGDPARANMLNALLDGRAKTAGELAYFARVQPQTASLHLRRLVEANLLSVLQQGRHRYFRLASPAVGRMLEAISEVAAGSPQRYRPFSPKDEALRAARMCYDHLAGRLAVEIAKSLVAQGAVVLDADGGEVTPDGFRLFERLGVDLAGAGGARRKFCRPCLDWTERRFHLAGAVGAALARHCEREEWIVRIKDSRAVALTEIGRAALAERLGLHVHSLAEVA